MAETVKSLAALILFCCMSSTMLFAQAPSAPAQPDGSAAKFPAASANANTKLTYKIIDAPKHTYCYDVFGDGRLMIHQTSVAALPGNEGFKTKEDATKVALLAIDKIRKVSAQSVIGSFAIDLPLVGNPGVECRKTSNQNYKIVFNFNNVLTSVDSVATSCGSVLSSAISGGDVHQFIVNLTGVACNTQDITVTLTGVHDDQGNTLASASAMMGLLIGDVSGDGIVAQHDVNLTKHDLGQKATSVNFREDVNVSGHIDASDVFLVKTQVGHMLPP